MPIVVSYDTVNALGGAAIQAGYQSGMAQGNQNYLARQQSDTQMLMEQAFRRHNQDREFQLSEISAGRQRNFAAEQKNLDRQADIEGQYLRGGIAAGQDERNFQQQLQAMQYQDQLTGQRQLTNMNDQQQFTEQQNLAKRTAEDKSYLDAAVQRGIPIQQAQQDLAKIRMDEQARTGNFAPAAGRRGAGMGQGGIGTLTGEWTQRGWLAMQSGDFTALEVAKNSRDFRKKDQAVVDVMQGIYANAKTLPTDQLEASLAVAPPEVRRVIEAELHNRGAMNFGSNQASPSGGGQDLQGLSDQQLIQMYQQLKGGN